MSRRCNSGDVLNVADLAQRVCTKVSTSDLWLDVNNLQRFDRIFKNKFEYQHKVSAVGTVGPSMFVCVAFVHISRLHPYRASERKQSSPMMKNIAVKT